MQVLPRILVTPEETWEPHVYAESEDGTYKEVLTCLISKEEMKFKLEKKYPNYNSRTWNEKKYFWHSAIDSSTGGSKETSFCLASENKLNLLFSIPTYGELITVTKDNQLVIANYGVKRFEIWGSEKGSYVLLDSFNERWNWFQECYELDHDEIIMITSGLSYSILSIDDGKFEELGGGYEYCLGDLRFDEYENLNLFDVLALNPRELVISISNTLLITNFVNGAGEVLAKFKLNQGNLHLITPDIFLLESDTGNKFHLFQKKNETWTRFHSITSDNIGIDRKFYILPPGRLEILRKARLLPIEINLELRAAVIEFLY